MSKKKWPIIREIQYKSGASAYMVDGRIGGKGKRHFFETKGEAEIRAQQLRVVRENEGAAAIKNFDERLRLEALRCSEKKPGCTKSGVTISLGKLLPPRSHSDELRCVLGVEKGVRFTLWYCQIDTTKPSLN